MAGFGGSGWGSSPWGGSLSVASGILVYPLTTTIDSEITVAGNGSLLDKSYNDLFAVPVLTNALWTNSITGSVSYTEDANRLNVTLSNAIVGSSYELLSVSTYAAADLEFKYEILSPFMGDTTADHITYAGLELNDGGTSLFIRRQLLADVGQVIVAGVIVDSVTYTTVVTQNSDASGTLRLITYNGVLTALHNDTVILYVKNTNLVSTTLSARLISETTEPNKSVRVKYKSYKSNFGVAFGDVHLINKTFNSKDRIIGTVPASSTVGSVTVSVFNHDGLLDTAAEDFVYPLITYVHLSSANNLDATIQNDPTLRD